MVLDPRPNVNTSFASTAGATTAFNSGGTVTAATDPRFASNVGTHSTSLDHTAQEVRRLEQRVVEVERKLREFEAQAPRR